MNRADFMNQLESLLQGIASSEREEAIQYYNDYFDDAGAENEREVIEALGNPARVAENIRKDLLDSGYGKKPAGKAKASDRALMEYGQSEQENEAEDGQSAGSGDGRDKAVFGPENMGRRTDFADKDRGGFGSESGGAREDSAPRGWNPFEGYGKSKDDTVPDEDAYRWSHDTAGWFGSEPEKDRKAGMPVWAIALTVTVLIFLSPFLGGLAMGLVGMLLGWFGIILGSGCAAIGLLIAFVLLVIVGVVCLFVNPWVGMAVAGGGLLLGCVGILLMMLTVAMAGIVTPAIFRGLCALFRFLKRKITAGGK
ncbi:MAG: DUF1700 domain-containing protein [Lachnospiraceae bacterium]|nr:DUF1700 domain-containing protein [Lachnospiraceae bacterium]